MHGPARLTYFSVLVCCLIVNGETADPKPAGCTKNIGETCTKLSDCCITTDNPDPSVYKGEDYTNCVNGICCKSYKTDSCTSNEDCCWNPEGPAKKGPETCALKPGTKFMECGVCIRAKQKCGPKEPCCDGAACPAAVAGKSSKCPCYAVGAPCSQRHSGGRECCNPGDNGCKAGVCVKK